MTAFLAILKIVGPFVLQIIGAWLASKGHANAQIAGDIPLSDQLGPVYGQGLAGVAAFLGGSGWHIANLIHAQKSPPIAPAGTDDMLHTLVAAYSQGLSLGASDEQLTAVEAAMKARRRKSQ